MGKQRKRGRQGGRSVGGGPTSGRGPTDARGRSRDDRGARDGSAPRIGRRPSSPGFLLAIALAWIAAGIAALAGLHAGWKLIPGILFIGIGLFWLRGAAGTLVRRAGRDRNR